MANKTKSGPQFVGYFPVVVQALKDLGGSARPSEVRDKVAEIANITDAEQSEPLPSGQPRFDNQVAWARFYLCKAGYIDASRRGVWSLTDKGRTATLSSSDALALFRSVHATFVNTGAEEAETEPGAEDAPAPESDVIAANHRVRVLEVLRGLSPPGFERFAQRLLRESGFQDVTITGRSGDEGIDGIGILQVNPLVSFKVLFQCKRYKGPVAPSQVRDFRGSMQGRADKGIIITTGTFTADSKKEAVRDGVPPIELVDGEKLVTMLEELELGLSPVRVYRIEESFFDDFRE